MMRIDVLYNEGVISLGDVAKLGRENIRKVNMENIDMVKELVGEEKTGIIVKKINEMSKTKAMSEEEKYAMEFLESLQKEPIKVYEEDGYVVGHQYNIIAQIGTAKYRDAHVRVSKKEGYLYYGSLWFETEHGKRSINYEMDTNRNIFFNRNINRLYYYELVNLTRKVIGWFEEHMNNAEEIDLDAIDKAIENIFE